MPVHEIQIRPEVGVDAEAITRVITDAFANHPFSDQGEARLVRALREAQALTLSLVAVDGSEIVGHVAFSPVQLSGGAPNWYGLAPVAVAPARQRAGIGAALIEAGLARLRAIGAAGCVVLGDPAYYQRFGFELGSGLVYVGGPPGHFMAQAFAGTVPRGEVAYHAAFDGP